MSSFLQSVSDENLYFGWHNSGLWCQFSDYGDGCYDNLFDVYLELDREGSAPNLNFSSSLIRIQWSIFARLMHSTSQFDKTSLSKCVCVCMCKCTRTRKYSTDMYMYIHICMRRYVGVANALIYDYLCKLAAL